jgi:hypothetical protein
VTTATGYSGTTTNTSTTALRTNAAGLPPVDALDTRVEHGMPDDGGNRRILGGISAVAVTW